MEKYLSVEDVVAITGYKKSYLYKMMHQHDIAYYRPNNGKAVFIEADVKAFMARGRITPNYEANKEGGI